jgi:hypothetical protein
LLHRYLASQRLPRTVRRTVQALLWSRIDELSSLTSLVAQESVIEDHQIDALAEAISSAWTAAATTAFDEDEVLNLLA